MADNNQDSTTIVSGTPGAPGINGVVKYANGSVMNGVGDERNRFECFARWIAEHSDREGILLNLSKKKSTKYVAELTLQVRQEVKKANGMAITAPLTSSAPTTAPPQSKEQERSPQRDGDFRKRRMQERIARESELSGLTLR